MTKHRKAYSLLVYILLLGFISLSLISCQCSTESNGDRDKIWFDFGTSSAEEIVGSSSYPLEGVNDQIEVPFERQAGVKFVSVKLNGIPMEMILDTGCSSTLISVAEANYLYSKGLISDEDIIGETYSQIADGSLRVGLEINLRELEIGGEEALTFKNVRAVIDKNVNAPLLLGNEVFDRVGSITVDNDREVVIFSR
ncbi:TIGR02281 family clan AA aspartic protease [uncultured Porphyromonas sp.]|jgi:predicted aspartyl protease|uniref:retropepsin-like aspartic protease family protein n=1 Tax=uncultured Porphyromonas sp. TaxID=159274 RepID=UPI00263A1B74|nr:retropepsin-like aspartic protease [uncultured Porphyromonas sp.]